MKCQSKFEDCTWYFSFEFEPEVGDGDFSESVKVGRDSFKIEMPPGFDSSSLHPDLYALAIILACYPFIGERLVLDRAVTPEFSEAFHRLSNKLVSPVDKNLSVREIPKYPIPGLAFSGGVDSTAALALLPNSAASIFLDRIIPEGERTLYRKDAVNYAISELRKHGRSVHSIRTDLEYIRNPVGFPVDVSNSIPAILLADHLGLDSIAFGMILESAYRLGHEKYMDYEHRSHFKRWGKLFDIAGVPFNLVTAGISEVGTSKIALESEFGYLAQSCMRGEPMKPCFNCWKCFRKLLLDRTLKSEDLPEGLLDQAFSIKEAKRFLAKDLIKHQNVIEFIADRYDGDHEGMRLMSAKVRQNGDVSLFEKWYSKSIRFVPAQHREFVTRKISHYLAEMSPNEEEALENYSLENLLVSEEYKEHAEKFAKYLS